MNDTILIVDDVPDNMNLLHRFLSKRGFKILIAQDGQGSLETVNYARPDMILLDVMMPGMSGFEVCECLKADPKTRDIPIIFMTALTDTVDKVKGFRLGAADYITKPFQHEEVLARINAHLQLSRLQKELQQKNQELDTFAHTVAHDLKNPLGVVSSMLQMLQKDIEKGAALDDKQAQKIALGQRNLTRSFQIIDSLLLLSGVSRQSNPEIATVDMMDEDLR